MYESFYNLTSKPFGLNPDPKFYYGSKEHSRVLAYLRYGINQGEGFIVVSGDVGAGKTILIGALLQELSKDKDIVAAQLVTTQLEPDDLLRMVSGAFGLSYKGMNKSELLNGIESFLRKQDEAGKRVLLVVDEAQNLQHHSLEELRMLSNFQSGSHSLLQSFLLGQAEFRDTLRSPDLEQFRQRIIASYHLGPMGRSETKGYIEHRMKVAGWKSDPHFSNDSFGVIYDYTEGMPRRINTLCDRVLLYAFTEESHDITVDILNAVIEELDGEIHFNRDEIVETAETNTGAALNISLSGTAPQPVELTGDVAQQLAQLNARVQHLEFVLSKARELLTAILIKN